MYSPLNGFGRTGDHAWHVDGRPERLRAMCEASLRRLRLEVRLTAEDMAALG
ncbi:hypothetical protein [Streptomyces mirabilis]|uniref:hypothetical protein n=1 Tax=Streptomyces mirabilis TaxID=68239 RepID=UPI0036DF993C